MASLKLIPASIPAPAGPLLLVIMDGVGIGPAYPGNAVANARTPFLDGAFAGGLYAQLRAHGPAVGLPSEDDMGNSEVGHNALGAGRVFSQGALLVNRAFDDGTLFHTELWEDMMQRHAAGWTLHFVGLLSNGNVHSHIRHLLAMVREAARRGVRRIRVHTLLDGRDVAEKSALDFLEPAEHLLEELSETTGKDYRIASGGGRMRVTMDRYNADWSIVERGYQAHVHGIGRRFASASEAVRTYYEEDPSITDQYMDAFVVADEDGPVGRILDGDSVVFFNFRGDRAIEFSRAMTEEHFREFDRGHAPKIQYAGMMEYDGDLHIPPHYFVEPPSIERTIGEYLCTAGITSFAISETQKYGHVTYFWNGNNSGYIDPALEHYVEIPSDRIEFDKAPRMKAAEITDATIELLRTGRYRFGRVNLANGDMVGHTGNYEATLEAVETVDACVHRMARAVLDLQGTIVITADHGNADEMYTDEDGVRLPKTSHTLNPVPFCILDARNPRPFRLAQIEQPGLANVAATLLNLLGFRKPRDYQLSLIERA